MSLDPHFRQHSNEASLSLTKPGLVPLDAHPNVSVKSDDSFLKGLTRVHEIAKALKVSFPNNQALSLELKGKNKLIVSAQTEALLEFEIHSNSDMRLRKGEHATVLTMKIDNEDVEVEIQERMTGGYVLKDRAVQRTTSPWRKPERESHYDHASESGSGLTGGGER